MACWNWSRPSSSCPHASCAGAVTRKIAQSVRPHYGIYDQGYCQKQFHAFSFLRGEHAYYTVVVHGTKYVYPVNLKDLGGASIFAEMKAITMMRYIRKALEDKTFVKAG